MLVSWPGSAKENPNTVLPALHHVSFKTAREWRPYRPLDICLGRAIELREPTCNPWSSKSIARRGTSWIKTSSYPNMLHREQRHDCAGSEIGCLEVDYEWVINHVWRCVGDILRTSFSIAQRGVWLFVYNASEPVILDLPRMDAVWEPLVARKAEFSKTNDTAGRLSETFWPPGCSWHPMRFLKGVK